MKWSESMVFSDSISDSRPTHCCGHGHTATAQLPQPSGSQILTITSHCVQSINRNVCRHKQILFSNRDEDSERGSTATRLCPFESQLHEPSQQRSRTSPACPTVPRGAHTFVFLGRRVVDLVAGLVGRFLADPHTSRRDGTRPCLCTGGGTISVVTDSTVADDARLLSDTSSLSR